MDRAFKPIVFFLLFFTIFSEESQAKLAPALYVFGDSTLDAGNFNGTSTPPYGIDFPGGHSSRITNGFITADFFAQWLGLKNLPPPYLHYSNPTQSNVIEGFNYACRAAGILSKTGLKQGRLWSLGEQVQRFDETVKNYLPKKFKSHAKLLKHLSKSIFLVGIGGNDYGLRFVFPGDKPMLPPSLFAKLLVNQLGVHLKHLYKLGARKYVVSEIGAMGCSIIFRKLKNETSCLPDLNDLARIYNEQLTSKLSQLNSQLKGSTIVRLKAYDLTYGLITNPKAYGMSNSKDPCCEIGAIGTCVPKKEACKNRDQYVFFDAVHGTQATYKVFALSCFNGTGVCVPFNIKHLAKM